MPTAAASITAEPVVRFVGLCALERRRGCRDRRHLAGNRRNACRWSDFLANLWTWWQGDAVGNGHRHAADPELACGRMAALLAGSCARSARPRLRAGGHRLPGLRRHASGQPLGSLAFLTLPFIIWAAIRYGPRGVTTATAMLCARLPSGHALRKRRSVRRGNRPTSRSCTCSRTRARSRSPGSC